MRPLELTGSRFGRLVVLGISPGGFAGATEWECRCDCGKQIKTRGSRLKEGRVNSCGCLISETAKESKNLFTESHGLSRSRTYSSWQNMKNRCRNPGANDFEHYGGRGIGYCERWEEFEHFYNDMGTRPVGTTLDRIEVDGDYELGNCRWANNETQSSNKRKTVLHDYRGDKYTLQQLCKMTGSCRSTVTYRLNKGMCIEEALK